MAKVFIAAEIVVESRLLPINAFEIQSHWIASWHRIENLLETIWIQDPYGFYH
jgi:hypothetical protein